MMIWRQGVLGFLIGFCGVWGDIGPSLLRAQELPTPAEETVKEPKKKPKKLRKFLSLALGVPHDEKLTVKVKHPKTKGDYRKIATVEYSPELKSLRITPKGEGIVTLQIYDGSDPKQRILFEYRLEIRKNRLDSIAREIKSLLGDIEGITIKLVNNKVVVDGQLVIPKDMNRIYTVVQQYGDLATSFVTLSPVAQRKIAEYIEKEIGQPEITVKALNEKFFLSGEARSQDEKDKAEIIAKAYIQPIYMEPAERDNVLRKQRAANDGIINLISVKMPGAPPIEKHIQVVVHYVELSKDYNKSFKFQFTPGLANDATNFTYNQSSGGSFSLSGTINNLLPKLNWAKGHGFARILESSTIMVQNRKKGVLNSVREYPFLTSGGNNNPPVTSFKEVGISTSVTPTIIEEHSDSVVLNLEFEVSSLVQATSAGPLTTKNKMSTDVTVRSGQSAAIGGVITNNSQTTYNKPDNNNPNPIISLLASKEFQRGQTQFVVFVTPIIKGNASSGAEKVKRKFRLGSSGN